MKIKRKVNGEIIEVTLTNSEIERAYNKQARKPTPLGVG